MTYVLPPTGQHASSAVIFALRTIVVSRMSGRDVGELFEVFGYQATESEKLRQRAAGVVRSDELARRKIKRLQCQVRNYEEQLAAAVGHLGQQTTLRRVRRRSSPGTTDAPRASTTANVQATVQSQLEWNEDLLRKIVALLPAGNWLCSMTVDAVSKNFAKLACSCVDILQLVSSSDAQAQGTKLRESQLTHMSWSCLQLHKFRQSVQHAHLQSSLWTLSAADTETPGTNVALQRTLHHLDNLGDQFQSLLAQVASAVRTSSTMTWKLHSEAGNTSRLTRILKRISTLDNAASAVQLQHACVCLLAAAIDAENDFVNAAKTNIDGGTFKDRISHESRSVTSKQSRVARELSAETDVIGLEESRRRLLRLRLEAVTGTMADVRRTLAAMVEAPSLTPAVVVRALDAVHHSTSAVHDNLEEAIECYQQKEKETLGNKALQLERAFYVYFYNNPSSLRRALDMLSEK